MGHSGASVEGLIQGVDRVREDVKWAREDQELKGVERAREAGGY